MKLPPYENHASYRKHRKQAWLQIYVPILIIIILGFAMAFVMGSSAMKGQGDSQRWAAISTIWLVVPILIFSLVVIALLVSGIYLMMRLLKLIPPYSAKAQYLVNQTVQKTRYYADQSVKPVLFVEGVLASIKVFFRRD
jgi:flagellar basal body-associated protein FliL